MSTPAADRRRLTVGVGARPGVAAAELAALIATLGLDPATVDALATIDGRAGEVRAVAAALGWPVVTFTAAELAAVHVPNPSGAVLGAVGTASVAEAAALLAAGGGELLVPKRSSARATVAVAEHIEPLDRNPTYE